MKWKYLPPMLLIILSYLVISPFLGMYIFTHDFGMLLFEHIFNPALIVFLAVLILNPFWALLTPWESAELARWNLLLKVLLIPFYVFTFVFGIGVPLAIVFLFLIDAILMVTTSTYGLRATVQAKKEGRISKAMCIILFLCHFFFIADVGAAFVLKQRIK